MLSVASGPRVVFGFGAAFRAGLLVHQFGLVRDESITAVVHGFRAGRLLGRLLAVQGESSLCPPYRPLPVLDSIMTASPVKPS
jgi:hypothetical protein